MPFIATYRREYVEPELDVHDLWKVLHWDEKVSLIVHIVLCITCHYVYTGFNVIFSGINLLQKIVFAAISILSIVINSKVC